MYKRYWSNPIAVALLVFGLAAAIVSFRLVTAYEDRSTLRQLSADADIFIERIIERSDVNLTIMQSLRRFFLASDTVTYQQFKMFAAPFVEAREDIHTMEWIPKVSRKDQQKIEQELSAIYGKPISIARHDINYEKRNEHDIEQETELYPIYYIYPFEHFEFAPGLNIDGVNERHEAITKAKMLDRPVMSPIVKDSKIFGSSLDVLFFLAIDSNTNEDMAKDGNQFHHGFIVASFRLDRLLMLALANIDHNFDSSKIEWRDSSSANSQFVVINRDKTNREANLNLHQFIKKINLGEREWQLRFTVDDSYLAMQRTVLAKALFVAILITFGLLAWYLASLREKNRMIQSLAEERSLDLSREISKSEIIINNSIEAIITIDQRGNVNTMNPAAQKMFGYSEAEVIGNNVKMLMPSPYAEEHDSYLKRYQDTGQAKIIGTTRKVEGKKKDGTIFPIHLSVGETQMKGNPLYIGVISDISRQVKYEEYLKLAKEQAEQANKQKSVFLNMMSHELRTPLTVVLGYLPILRNTETPPPPEIVRSIAEDMNTSGQHLLELINDILDISKIEAGQMTLHHEKVGPQKLVDEVLSQFKTLAENKSLDLINKAAVQEFTLDPRRYKQILFNLIGNSMKFTENGSISVTCQLNAENQLITRVSDTGIGIETNDIETIFDSFKQVDSSSTRKTGGTGLGLAITRKLVELHGGQIEVRSEPGQGTTFEFTLPLNKESD